MPFQPWLRNQWTDVKGNAKWDLIKGAAGGVMLTGAKAILDKIQHVPTDWLLYIGFFLLSVLAFLYVARKPKTGPAAQSSSTQAILSAPPTEDVEAFYRTYDNQLLRDIENHVSSLASRFAEGQNRERFLVRYISGTLAQGLLLLTWANIYRSQILTLRALNAKPAGIRRGDLRPIYEEASASDPKYYQNYEFGQWLGFLKNWALILEEPGDIIKITVRGRELLKYMLDQGWSETDRQR